MNNSSILNIVAVDFDGTLCEDNFPEIGPAKPHIIKYIKSLQQSGCKIILWTCRTGKELEQAVEWCKEHNIVFDSVNKNLPEIQEKWGGDTRKVYCDAYIDDKNMFISGVND